MFVYKLKNSLHLQNEIDPKPFKNKNEQSETLGDQPLQV